MEPTLEERQQWSEYAVAYAFLKSRICSVEIQWGPRVSLLYFPLPLQTYSLTSGTKAKLLESIDLSTPDAKAKEFLAACNDLVDEMNYLYELRDSRFFQWLSSDYGDMKRAALALALLANLLVLVTATETGSILGIDSYEFGEATNNSILASTLVLLITLVLIALYAFQVCFLVLSRFPLIKSGLQRAARDLAETSFEPELLLDSFAPWLYGVFSYMLFIGLMLAVEADSHIATLWACVPLFGLWALVTLRRHWELPPSPAAFWYCTAYDSLREADMAGTSLLLFFACCALFRSWYYPLLLLDVVSMSPILKNTIRAVTHPIKQIMLTFALLVIVLLVFGFIAFYFFADDLVTDDDVSQCDTLAHCFFATFVSGFRDGDLVDAMEEKTHEDGVDWVNRMVYDMTFFLVVGQILFAIVTGIIVDTFGALREEANERADTLKNSCFICNIARSDYDEYGATESFDTHKEVDHHLWNYAYVIAYLSAKDETEMNGGESYVWAKLQDGDPSWLPNKSSWALQNISAAAAPDETVEEKLDRLMALVEKQGEVIASLQGVVGSSE